MVREPPERILERIDDAARLFAEQGFEATHIADIAEATQVPKATLYYYFTGKEEILATLLRRMLDVVGESVEAAVGAGGTARERIERLVRAQIDVVSRHRDACRLLLDELGRITRIPDLAIEIRAVFHEPVEKVLVEGQEDGTLVDLDPEAVASAVFGAVAMTGLHYLLAGDLEPERVTAVVLELLLGGMAAR